eukprot:scaffold26562_cov18-Tisochrysis_lutea.AAC.2
MGEVGAGGGGQEDRRDVAPSAAPSKLRATAPSFVPQAWKERAQALTSVQGLSDPVAYVGLPPESGQPFLPSCSILDLPHDVSCHARCLSQQYSLLGIVPCSEEKRCTI